MKTLSITSVACEAALIAIALGLVLLAIVSLSGCGLTFAPPDPYMQYQLDRQQDITREQLNEASEQNYEQMQAAQPVYCFAAGDVEVCR